ncbi:MAG: Arm DNA-binding domain-containing protein, partial [Bullifex sp.]
MANINVTKRGSTWQYRFETARVDGKRKQFSKSGFRTKKEAQEAGAKALSEYNSGGTAFRAAEISVADYMKQWLETGATANYKANTLRTYTGIVNNHIIPTIGHYRLSSMTPSSLALFVNSLKNANLSQKTINVAMAVLSSSLDYAVEPLRYIKDNPMRYVKAPQSEKTPRKREVISDENWGDIMKMFPAGNTYHIPFMIGYYCALRISECIALTWDDVDLENCTVNVNKQLS